MRRARLSTKALQAWADLNGVELHGVAVKDLRNGQGAGLVATQDASKEGAIFVRVPKELVLSKDLVWEYALSDPALREVLDSMGEWAQVGWPFLSRPSLKSEDSSRIHHSISADSSDYYISRCHGSNWTAKPIH
jgi:hypothetical protein